MFNKWSFCNFIIVLNSFKKNFELKVIISLYIQYFNYCIGDFISIGEDEVQQAGDGLSPQE